MNALAPAENSKCVAVAPRYIFAVRAAPDPQVVSRIAGLFAQRNLLPEQLCSRRSGEFLLIDIEVALESREAAHTVIEKIRSLVAIERAALVELDDNGAARARGAQGLVSRFR